MKVAVTGATGVIGTSAVAALVAGGHDVFGLVRTPAKAGRVEALGATPVEASLFDHDSLVGAFEGCDVVCSFATHVPVGASAVLDRSWRQNDRLRTDGVRRVVDAARAAHVRRVVQESVSMLYADQGDDWITESSPLDITRATEPASVAELHLQEYQSEPRHGVVLRFGQILGDDDSTRWMLRTAHLGRRSVATRMTGWAHVIHTDDLGPAVVAALTAPSGVYNVGAEPVRREEIVGAIGAASRRRHPSVTGPVLRRIAGSRVEPAFRSLRVCSEHFTAQTGWVPRRPRFDASWFDGLTRQAATS